MSNLELTSLDIADLLHQVAADIKERADELRELDALLGDGDLGITVNLLAQALPEYLDASEERDVGLLLSRCGLHINRMNPSTFGTIVAIGFMGAGKSVKGKEQITLNDLLAMGESAVASIQQRGRAKPGDKTLLDTLVPALEAFKRALDHRLEPESALADAVQAAEQGVKATAAMQARIGRAKTFQEKSIGVQDGGATAMYYMIESFARHLAARRQVQGGS